MKMRTAMTLVAIVCAAARATAQDAGTNPPPANEDSRTQYPAFMANSYFSFNVGSIGYLFSERQLEPGFEAESIDKPRLAVRVDLFGHHFSKYFSTHVTYMRPARYVAYRNVNGSGSSSQVSNAYGGLTSSVHLPLSERFTGYAEGGLGITSRSGFDIDGKPAVKQAHYASGLVGGGLAYHSKRNMDVMLGWTYLPGRRSVAQPSTRLYTLGVRYHMRPIDGAKVDENREAGFAFPPNIVRIGLTMNAVGYGVNDFFSRKVPIFWGGDVETRTGFTLDYQRNVFHTKKRFAFDLGGSTSYWRSNGDRQVFWTLSAYPLFRFFVARTESAELYFCYSLAGPTFISQPILDGKITGRRFTFQDFMGFGAFLDRTRHLNIELGIKHFSNGNLFPNNSSIKVPLTLTLGVAF